MPKKTKTPKRKPTREELMARLPIPGPGRYPFFSEPAELQVAVDKFFTDCERHKRLPGVCALAYALGFLDRNQVREYEKKPAFSGIIKRALLRIEMAKETWLHSGVGSTTGLIFDLKNHHGWTDRQELTGANGQPLSFAAVTIYLPDNGRGPGKG